MVGLEGSDTASYWVSVTFQGLLLLNFGGVSSGQITIIPKPELRALLGDSLTKLPFGVTSAEVAIICPGIMVHVDTADERQPAPPGVYTIMQLMG